ncbi:Ribosomal small subunit pseudouridine synthase A [Enhygromyxa salina]|uniref:Ribosomal small subunit pseudouridine synthase A n=1 Tax=Enhygromyxa salina TaxID=215803 RepID=A0A2S9YJL6_9BACT|nr:pseudouridine synthase [Enhygromyxa salina]PRQ05271.1 Ribosomal small subunit pseudouridine synthase A [Enhygromyxa salina]
MPRLDQLLARNLGRSRREVTRLLRRGAVSRPGGETLRAGRTPIELAELPVELLVSGVPVRLREHAHLIQHKPVGVVTSRNDPLHPTALDLLEGAPMHALLRAVGRLDLDAAGLLLWTTDTPMIHALTHPKRRVPRTYHVALARGWTPPPRGVDGSIELELADRSRPRIVELEPLAESARHPALEPPEGTGALATITLLDGAYHEVKRIFAALDSHVLRLARVAHAGLWLPEDLAAGAWRELDSLPNAAA